MYLPRLKEIKAKRAIIFLPEPELNYFKTHFRAEPITTFLGVKLYQKNNTLLCGPLISAPLVGLFFHLLSELSLEEILFIGWAGSLNKKLPPGSLFLPTKAYSFLGLTRFFFPRRKVFRPNLKFQGQLKGNLKKEGIPFWEGAILSTDYPFLEGKGKICFLKNKASALDMETAGFFALGESYKIPTAGLIFITDRVGEKRTVLPQELKGLRLKIQKILWNFVEGRIHAS